MLFKDLADLLIFFLGFMLLLSLAFLTLNTINKTSNKNLFASQTAANFILTHFIIIVFIFISYRMYSGFALWGYFNIASWGINWSTLSLVSAGFLFLAFNRSSLFKFETSNGELSAAMLLLTYVWCVSPFVRSIMSFFLMLEISGLALLLIFVCNIKALKATNSADVDHLKKQTLVSSILFLWVSIVAFLIFLAAIPLNNQYTNLITFEHAFLTNAFNTQSTNLSNLLLLLAILIKIMTAPFNILLFSFYKNMPLNSFLMYICFYYPGFLTLGLFIFLPYLSLQGLNFIYIFTLIVIFGSVLGVLQLKQTTNLKVVLAVSSLFTFLILSVSLVV